MPIVIKEIHGASKPEALNEEWFVVENAGDKPFSTAGCSVATGRGKAPRLRGIGTLDPGFTLAPNGRMRIVTGNPGKKAHGKPPAEDGELKNYHLFQVGPILAGAGTVVALSLKQHELARATFDPKAQLGVAPAPTAE